MYVYLRSEPGLYTVGFYTPTGQWIAESDHVNNEAAAKRVNYLNGGISADTISSIDVGGLLNALTHRGLPKSLAAALRRREGGDD